MNRKAAAAGTNSKSSHPWVRRLSRFKSRSPACSAPITGRLPQPQPLDLAVRRRTIKSAAKYCAAFSTVVQVRRSSSRWKPAEC